MLQTKKLIILDRDGVINHENPNYIRSPDDWKPIAGSLQAIAKLSAAGIRVAVATNQSGIARGYFDRETLALIHNKMQDMVQAVGGMIDKIVFCPHHPEDKCDCRKPNTGLLQQISEHFHLELSGVPFIGDSHKDVNAALSMACQPILVKTGYGTKSIDELSTMDTVTIYNNLSEAVDALLTEED